ncbi:MAG: hypothetical protein WB685_15410 [Pseudolabrys sp.]
MKHFASIFAITVTLLMAGSLRADPIYPDVANTSHATPEVTTFFKSYFTAKSEHKPVPTTDHFSEAHLTYIDATLGWPFYNKKAAKAASCGSEICKPLATSIVSLRGRNSMPWIIASTHPDRRFFRPAGVDELLKRHDRSTYRPDDTFARLLVSVP